MEPKKAYIPERTNGEKILVLGVHEAKFHKGRHSFNDKVFIVNIADDVLLDLDIM